MGYRAPLPNDLPSAWPDLIRALRRKRSDRRFPASAHRVAHIGSATFRGKR